MMLGYLLARAGLEVLVLEKHADFLRDFRGDTVHPSTLEIMHELGLLDDFLKFAAPPTHPGAGPHRRRRHYARRHVQAGHSVPIHGAHTAVGFS